MPFLTIGVEHRTSPLAIRERVAMDDEGVSRASRALIADPSVAEVAVLSTCNRTEIYCFSDAPAEAGSALRVYLTALDADLAPYLQQWEEMDAVEHLFRTASGLESQVLGEPQILSQVREALETAQRLKTIGPNLHSLFRAAISCARQARAGTQLGHVNISLGWEAVREAEQALGPLEPRSALLIGGGEISRLVGEELRARNVGRLFIANRTESVAVELAHRFHGTPVRLEDISRVLGAVDVIFTATSAHQYMLTAEDLSAAGRLETAPPLHIFDLAIPRDVDPAVGALDGIVVHDLDGLLPAGLAEQWGDDIRVMESVIAAEIHEFTAWYLTRRVVPVISHLRRHVEAVSRAELKRVAPQLADLTEREHRAVESLTQRLIDKMFHHLVTRLRLAAQTDSKLVDAAEFFFLHGEGGLFEHAEEQETGKATSREG